MRLSATRMSQLRHSVVTNRSRCIRHGYCHSRHFFRVRNIITILQHLQGVPIKSDRQQCFIIISINTGILNPFLAILSSLLCHTMPSFVHSSLVWKFFYHFLVAIFISKTLTPRDKLKAVRKKDTLTSFL